MNSMGTGAGARLGHSPSHSFYKKCSSSVPGSGPGSGITGVNEQVPPWP